MSLGTGVFLAGLLVVPLLFLALGHKWRRRSPRQRAAFWGGLTGYLVAAGAAMWVGMIPAAEWSPTDTVRGALGFWSLLVAPALGAAIGAIAARNRPR
jgi:hypothetical protein